MFRYRKVSTHLKHAEGESTEKVEKRDFEPFPTATSLHKIFTSFTIFIVFQCFRSIASLPCKIVREIDTTPSKKSFYRQGFFAEGERFLSLGNVEDPRKRVEEGLCGWRHGNSFPMTQSAQSHRQMRSIPHCSKAVFYVFVFDSIHDSATMHNLSLEIFH